MQASIASCFVWVRLGFGSKDVDVVEDQSRKNFAI